MYKKGVRSMPRCFKKELVRLYQEFDSINDIKPLVYPGSYHEKEDEQRIVSLLSQISGLPSYWLVTSPHKNRFGVFWIVFEKKLDRKTEDDLRIIAKNGRNIFNFFIYTSFSPYYGIY